MPTGSSLIVLAVLVLAAAFVYSSGGHAGATAYLALMAFFAVPAAQMRPVALVMNIGVAVVASFRFARVRAVPWPLLKPLLLGALPSAFLGGRMRLSAEIYLTVLGGFLCVAAMLLLRRPVQPPTQRPLSSGSLVGIGAVLGFVAGLSGIGGGIFLSPLLLLAGWATPRDASGAAAIFILGNSVLGLLGQLQSAVVLPPQTWLLAAVAVCGGLVGSWLGAHRLPLLLLRRVHGAIVLISGVKLLSEGLALFR